MRPADIPNAICLLRMLLVAPTVWALFERRFVLALGLVVLAGLSDLLDGYLAKRFDWRSRLGAMLDPLADKLLLVSLFISLALLGCVPLWLAAVVLGRDVVIVAGALAYNWLIGPLHPEPSVVGKFNTLAQLICVIFVLIEQGTRMPLGPLVVVSGAAVLVMGVVSGIDYVLRWSLRAAGERT
ncbi:MAG: CDP-alcohol phosphatidyltransferase family protein [Gammaproteobacteria bacterium]|nr:CDP-alcohol phosphatidyltransferase family protein [Gammaproteobacteria bacterium]